MTTPADGSTARSGELGKAVIEDTLVARITKWSLEDSVGESAWGDSDSEGYTNRKAARKDCTGSLEGKFDEDSPVYDLFATGDIVELVLWETATDYWAFPRALMKNFKITYDQDTKEVVGWTADFGADGKFYRPGAVGAPAHTLP
jgi:hypothetical protein